MGFTTAEILREDIVEEVGVTAFSFEDEVRFIFFIETAYLLLVAAVSKISVQSEYTTKARKRNPRN